MHAAYVHLSWKWVRIQATIVARVFIPTLRDFCALVTLYFDPGDGAKYCYVCMSVRLHTSTSINCR